MSMFTVVMASVMIAFAVVLITMQVIILSSIADLKKRIGTKPESSPQPRSFEPRRNDRPQDRPQHDRNRDPRGPRESRDQRPRPQQQPQPVTPPAPATTAVDSSLRDINLRLKNAERDMENERRRLQGALPKKEGDGADQPSSERPDRPDREDRGDRPRGDFRPRGDRDREFRPRGGQGGRDRGRGGRDNRDRDNRDRGGHGYNGNRPSFDRPNQGSQSSPAPRAPEPEVSLDQIAPVAAPSMPAQVGAEGPVEHGRVTVKRRPIEDSAIQDNQQTNGIGPEAAGSGSESTPPAPDAGEISFGRR
jgi:hypothetical protein